MHILIYLLLTLRLCLGDLYPNYNLSSDATKVLEWSENHILAYITTVRIFDDDHHLFQYRRYPCQYYYTDEIQVHHTNETSNQCVYNTTQSDYEYTFQLHLNARHIEPYILRNIAMSCDCINCSLSLMNITYIKIGWNFKGRESNPNCSFDTTQAYTIHRTPYALSESITLRCQSLSTCQQAKLNVEQSFVSQVQLIYGSSFDLDVPYCSLEKSLSHIIETNLAQTNRLLQQLLELMQRGFGTPNEREQSKMKEYVEKISVMP